MASTFNLETMLGQRRDGRIGTATRPKEVRWGELSQADGSTWFTQGNTAVLATVVGPTAARPNQEDYTGCIVEALINRAQPSAPNCGGASKSVADMKKNQLLQSDTVLQNELKRVLTSVVMVDRYPRCAITVSLNILKDDGSLLSACANAAMCALLNSGIYCRTTICSVSVTRWKRGTETTLWLDTTKDEESATRREDRIFGEEVPAAVANDPMPITAVDATLIMCNPPVNGNSIAAMVINTSIVSSPKVAKRASDDNPTVAAPICTLQDIQHLSKVAERCCLEPPKGIIEFIRGVMNPTLLHSETTGGDN